MTLRFKDNISIDGGAVYGGYLYGVILDVHGIKDYVYVWYL